jgi:NAD dependent epimerase/dehydratase family enzyme
MAEIVTDSQRAIPARAIALGHSFAHAALDGALAEALGHAPSSPA